MISNRVNGRLAQRVAKHQSEILARLAPSESGRSSVRIRPLGGRSVHEIAVLEVMHPQGSASYFLKATSSAYAGKQDLAKESAVLTDVGPKIAARNPKTRCPEVVAFYPQDKLLIEEFVSGLSLKSLLFDLGSFKTDLDCSLRLAGEWLAHFHDITQHGYANPFDWLQAGLVHSEVKSTFRRCSVTDLHALALRLLCHFSKQYPCLTRPLCQVHGEFTPLHILIQGDVLYVIDFGSTRRGFPYEDVAQFCTFPLGLLPWRSAMALIRCPVSRQISLFQNAYHQHRDWMNRLEDKVIMRFAWLLAMSRHQLNWELERNSGKSYARLRLAIRRSWTRRRFACLAQREIFQLQRLAKEGAGDAYPAPFPMQLRDTPLSE